MTASISKADAVRRQIDTAIDLWFEDCDGLSIFTLAFASLKVLMNVYPHQNNDGFDATLDKLIGETGWKSMSTTANFLKHADRDPDAVLKHFHPDMGMPVIGLVTILYRRLFGALSLKMKAFDSWIENIGAEELGIEEVDANPVRAAANKRIRAALKKAPRDVYIRFARDYYHFFLENHDRLEREVEEAIAGGNHFQEVLDEKFEALAERVQQANAT